MSDAPDGPRTSPQPFGRNRDTADVAAAVAALVKLAQRPLDVCQHRLQPIVRRHQGQPINRHAGAFTDPLAERDRTQLTSRGGELRQLGLELGPLGLEQRRQVANHELSLALDDVVHPDALRPGRVAALSA